LDVDHAGDSRATAEMVAVGLKDRGEASVLVPTSAQPVSTTARINMGARIFL
jgi:hypothetical protein